MAKNKEQIKDKKISSAKEKAKSVTQKKELRKAFNQKSFYAITVIGLVVLFALYYFVYLDYTDKTETLQASNAAIKADINELQTYYDNMAMYQSDIEAMKVEIQDIMSEYPAEAHEEDVIMLAVGMQKNNRIGFDSISMDSSEELYNISASEVVQASIDGMDTNLIFTGKRATYSITTTYDDLKSVISEIFDSENRIGINNIVLSKNEDSGTLGGSIDLNFYSATGTGKVYEAPDITAYLAGTSDIFKSNSDVSALEQEGEENGETAQEGDKKTN